jgi:hypothetical protein
MTSNAIHRWPSGERPVYFATPGAWEILHLVSQETLKPADVRQALATRSTRDIRGAYFLTRELHELRRREVLVQGDDDGRAARIRARNALRRAFEDTRLREEANRREHEIAPILEDIRAHPPTRPGRRLKTPREVLSLASSTQSLAVRLRLLVEVRVEDLEAGIDHLRPYAASESSAGRWPGGPEGRQLLWVLEQAVLLLKDLTA